MKFPEKINKLLETNGIKNLRKLAEEIDIPYTTLWDYYSSQVRLDKANLTYIKKIAKRLGCTIDYLSYDEIEDIMGVAANDVNESELDILYSKSKDFLNESERDIIKHSMQRAIDRYEEQKNNGK